MAQAQPQNNGEPSTDLFESAEEAARHLESYALRNGTCQYADNELEQAYVDGAKIEVVEYENGWGFEVSERDCQHMDLDSNVTDYLEP